MTELSYLASPYTHPKPAIVRLRYWAALLATNELREAGRAVYSPIVHWHQQVVLFNLPGDYEFWEKQNDVMMEVCSDLLVLKIKGYNTSEGVADEILKFTLAGKPVRYYVLKNQTTVPPVKLTAEFVTIAEAVAKKTNVKLSQILGSDSRSDIVWKARNLARLIFYNLNSHMNASKLADAIKLTPAAFNSSIAKAKDELLSVNADTYYKEIYEQIIFSILHPQNVAVRKIKAS
jgi:hypothetical protein